MNRYLDLLGISCLFGASLLFLWTFYRIITQGYFHVIEPNPLIAWIELGCAVGSMLYTLYLLKGWFK